MAKLKIRRGFRNNWSGTTLSSGQLGLIYEQSGQQYDTSKTPRLIVGTPSSDGSDKDSIYDPTSKTATPYLTPNPDVYTDTTIETSSGHKVSANPLNTNVLRNIIVSTTQPEASNYEEGTILLVYTP